MLLLEGQFVLEHHSGSDNKGRSSLHAAGAGPSNIDLQRCLGLSNIKSLSETNSQVTMLVVKCTAGLSVQVRYCLARPRWVLYPSRTNRGSDEAMSAMKSSSSGQKENNPHHWHFPCWGAVPPTALQINQRKGSERLLRQVHVNFQFANSSQLKGQRVAWPSHNLPA